MDEIKDIDANKEIILSCIKQYGFMPEHKYDYFLRLTDEGTPIFMKKGEEGVLGFIAEEKGEKIAKTLVEPLSKNPKEMMKEFIEHFIEKKGFDKVIFEARHEIRLELEKEMPAYDFKEDYNLIWPVFFMNNFDENLAGGKWKKIRYFKNKFFKDYNAELCDYNPSFNEQLKELVMKWKSQRTAKDETFYVRYLNMIDECFKGFDMVKVITVEGKPVSFFGGWKIINSKNYYSCVGIYDYDYENLGEVSNVLDLICLKKMGMEKVDFGGGDECLTNFKKKFFPDEFYRTDTMFVTKKKIKFDNI
jgi:hypothetical protein